MQYNLMQGDCLEHMWGKNEKTPITKNMAKHGEAFQKRLPKIIYIPRPAKGIQVLLHEIVHGLFIQQGVTDQDETLIERIAQSLYGLIKDNPELIKALLPQEELKLNLSFADKEAIGKLMNNFPNVIS